MLEQIKEELIDTKRYHCKNIHENKGYQQGINQGFDACMNLELPIKFANYLEQLTRTRKEDYYLYKLPTNDYQWFTANELFSHFLNNVYGK